MADKHLYDLIIVGAGPAGLSAGLYAGRATLDTLILEGDTVGGQVTTTSVVYNYPAVEKVDGTQLMNQMQKQVTDFGVTIAHDQVEKYQLADEVKLLVGCTEEDENDILEFLNQTEFQKAVLIRRGNEVPEWAQND